MTGKEVKEIIDRGLFKGEIKFDEPMSAHTYLGIGGPVEIMVFPEDPISLKNVLIAANQEEIPIFVFGAGTNLLVGDEKIHGIAISLKKFRSLEFTKDTDDIYAGLYVGSGLPLATLIKFAQKKGYSGLEALVGIPGYVGGAVYMNAGSFGVEIKDVIVSVAIMDKQGRIIILDRSKLDFSYRSSNLPEGSIILSANIMLKKDDPDEIEKRTRDYFLKKKDTQPLGEFSAGCVFKNPEGDAAGRLIDAAGCKGMRAGNVEVSSVHANYFISKGNSTYRDFIELMENVKTKVKESSGIELEPEIKIIGRNV